MHFNVFVRACVCLYACTYIIMYVRLAVFIFVGVIVWVRLRIYKQATVYIYVCLRHQKTKKKTYIRKKRRCVTKTKQEASSKRKIIKAEHKKVMILYDKNKQKNKITSTGSCIELSWDTIQFFLKSISERMSWISGNDYGLESAVGQKDTPTCCRSCFTLYKKAK